MKPSSRPPGPPPLPPAAPYRPQRLGRHALDVEVGPRLRSMPGAVRDEIVERRLEQAARFDLWSPRRIRRVRHHVAGSVLGFPLLHWIFTPLGFHALWIQVPVAAVFGLVLALVPIRGAAVGFLCVGTACVTLALAGYGSWLSLSYGVLFVMSAYFVIGLALGISEDLGRDEQA